MGAEPARCGRRSRSRGRPRSRRSLQVCPAFTEVSGRNAAAIDARIKTIQPAPLRELPVMSITQKLLSRLNSISKKHRVPHRGHGARWPLEKAAHRAEHATGATAPYVRSWWTWTAAVGGTALHMASTCAFSPAPRQFHVWPGG